MLNPRSYYHAILAGTRRDSGLPTYDESLADLRRVESARINRQTYSRL